MAFKILLLGLLILGFVYFVYRASDYYFSKREREDKFELRRRIHREARDAGIWADDDPDSFDPEEYRRAANQLGIEMEDE